jgi:hypothetical protein
MGFDAKSIVARLTNSFVKNRALLAHYVRGLVEARRQRLEHERKFFPNLKTFYRANNLSPICKDEWKTADYDKIDDNFSMIHSKGTVS